MHGTALQAFTRMRDEFPLDGHACVELCTLININVKHPPIND